MNCNEVREWLLNPLTKNSSAISRLNNNSSEVFLNMYSHVRIFRTTSISNHHTEKKKMVGIVLAKIFQTSFFSGRTLPQVLPCKTFLAEIKYDDWCQLKPIPKIYQRKDALLNWVLKNQRRSNLRFKYLPSYRKFLIKTSDGDYVMNTLPFKLRPD